MNTPLVSVIMPAYNAAETIFEAIDSVLKQSYTNVEVIVVDDGSEDNTEEIVNKFRTKVTYIKMNHAGFAAARNAGLKIAKGKYIAWLDSDDIFYPSKLERQLDYLNDNSDVGVVATEFSAFDENGKIDDHYMNTYYSALGKITPFLSTFEKISTCGEKSYKGKLFDLLLYGNFLHPPTLLFRRSILDKVGPQMENLSSAADYEYIMRLSLHTSLALLDVPLLNYRISDGQDSSHLNKLRKIPSQIFNMELLLKWPELTSLARRKVVYQNIRSLWLDLAREQAELFPLKAFNSLVSSFKYGYFLSFESFIILFKIMTPKYFMTLKRRLISFD